MRVLHLSTGDALGGAARAAYRLHSGLRRAGLDSRMLVGRRDTDDPTVREFVPPRGAMRRLRRFLRRRRIARDVARYRDSRAEGVGPFSDDRSQHGADLLSELPSSDVINLHWVAGLVDCGTFFAGVGGGPPVVWTLHDMNPFTGGCHCAMDCGKFRTGCGACPHLGSGDAKDLSYRVWRRKDEAYRAVPAGRLHVVSPSRWLAEQAESSGLLGGRPVSVIPHGIDTERFAPRGRKEARAGLGVPQDARVVLFVCQRLGVAFKGFRLLAEALAGLAGVPKLTLVAVGEGEVPAEVTVPCIRPGYVPDEDRLSLAYAAADAFVLPSLAENLPLTVLAAMACGTPVVGFDVGGVPDMVRPGVTGMLVPAGDTAELARAISALLGDDAKRAEMAAACRKVAVAEYSLGLQTRRYAALYERILSGAR